MLPTSREDLIQLLGGLDVDIPSTTKLSWDALDKRFRRALDCAQEVHLVPPSTSSAKTVDIGRLPKWGTGEATGRLKEPMWRPTWREKVFAPILGPSGFKNNELFKELRMVMGIIGICWDHGQKLLVLLDEAETSGIIMRLVSVYAVNKSTPLIVVVYAHPPPIDPRVNEWFNHQASKGKRRYKLKASIAVQNIFLHALQMNAKRIPNGFTVKSEKEHYMELECEDRVFRVRREASKKCVGCYTVLYCSKDCQRADWQEHKTTCKSLQGATWEPITFAHTLKEFGERDVARINGEALYGRFTPSRGRDDPPPPNKHGANPFVIKLKHNPGNDEPMMMYDRRGSIDGYYPCPNDAVGKKTYHKIVEMMPYKGTVMDKIYCWARRTGDWTLQVATNRLPDQNPGW